MDHTFIVSMETRLRVATLYINKYKAKIIKALLILILAGQYEEKSLFFIFFIFTHENLTFLQNQNLEGLLPLLLEMTLKIKTNIK